MHAMLRHSDVTRRLTVPVSAGLLTDTSAYFNALTAYRQGDVEPVVQQFAYASFRAVGAESGWGSALPIPWPRQPCSSRRQG